MSSSINTPYFQQNLPATTHHPFGSLNKLLYFCQSIYNHSTIMKLGFLLILLLPLLGHAYVSWRIWQLLPLPVWAKVCIMVLLFLAFASLFVSFMVAQKFPISATAAIYETGTTWIEILLYLVLIFLVLDILRLCHIVPSSLLRSNWWTIGAITLLLTGLFIYGNINYHNKVRVPVTLQSNKITKPLKVVMMSDLHLGFHNRRAEFARWVDLINKENPDMVLIAGDIIDFNAYPLLQENVAEEFKRFKAPVYACLGNHEYISGNTQAIKFYTDAGIHLLRDSVATIGDICIVGRDDRMNRKRKSLTNILSSVDKSKYLIVLDHQPYHLEEPAAEGVDFQLSGHTHHGQIWPISWITEAIYEVAFGPYKKGNTQFYVSSGVGIWGGKYRIGTQSEYIVANIQPAK